ncbi:MAG: GNAT family N-acetyltransferase [Gemmataceae bacterium]|nr:GNAT family N-acetyltransferase [Gemmataceae bacterium]
MDIRTELREGDVDAVASLHGTTYAREHGFDHSFEQYVREPLARFAENPVGGRVWLAEEGGRLVGCIAIVPGEEGWAQLRWFLVSPETRGQGLGRRLMGEALAFARERGYPGVYLWTVSALERAASLYRAAGFALVEEKPGAWGAAVLEQKYDLRLR